MNIDDMLASLKRIEKAKGDDLPLAKQLTGHFKRARQLVALRSAPSSHERAIAMEALGITIEHTPNGEQETLTVKINGVAKLSVDGLGARPKFTANQSPNESPDGAITPPKYDMTVEEADADGEAKLATLAAEEAEADSIYADLLASEPYIYGSPTCVASGPSAEDEPRFDCVESFFGGVGAYYTAKGIYQSSAAAIAAALAYMRIQVAYYQAAYAAGTITFALLADAMVGIVAAFVAASEAPWWAAAGLVLFVGYEAVQVAKCIANMFSPEWGEVDETAFLFIPLPAKMM